MLYGQTDPIKVAQRGILAPQVSAPSFSDTNVSYDLTVSYKVDHRPSCCSPRVAGPTGDYKFDEPGAGQRSWSRRRW